MKRIFALLLALAIVAFAVPAMAEQTEFTIIGGQSAMSPGYQDNEVLNKMQANHVSCLSYMPEPNSPMYQDVKEGRFQLISARECLEETRQLVEGLDYGPFHFTSNHASNYLPLKGTLPDDREKFLTMSDSALGGKSRIRSEYSRAL